MKSLRTPTVLHLNLKRGWGYTVEECRKEHLARFSAAVSAAESPKPMLQHHVPSQGNVQRGREEGGGKGRRRRGRWGWRLARKCHMWAMGMSVGGKGAVELQEWVTEWVSKKGTLPLSHFWSKGGTLLCSKCKTMGVASKN
jgi:hypothetical protein